MKLADATQDILALDPRPRGAGKDASDPSNGATADFAGVLSEVQASGGDEPSKAPPDPPDALTGQTGSGRPAASSWITPPRLSSGNAGLSAGADIGRPKIATQPDEPQPSVETPIVDVSATQTVEAGTAPGKADRVTSPQDLMTMLLGNSSLSNAAWSATSADSPAARAKSARSGDETFQAPVDSKAKARSESVPDGPEVQKTLDQAPAHDLMAMLLGGLAPPADTAVLATAPDRDGEKAAPATVVVGQSSAEKPIVEDPSIARASARMRQDNEIQSPALAADRPRASVADVAVSTHLGPVPPAAIAGAAAAASPSAGVQRSKTQDPVAEQSLGDSTKASGLAGRPADAPLEPRPAASVLAEPSPEGSDHPSLGTTEGRTSPEAKLPNALGETSRVPDPASVNVMTTISSRPATSELAAAVVRAVAQSQPIEASAAPVAAARTLTLRMDQADLGPVQVRMHLSGGELDLQLTASDQDTLSILRRERESIASAIDDGGYRLHSLTIHEGATVRNDAGGPIGSGGTGSAYDRPGQDTQRGDRNNAHPERNRSAQQDGPGESAHRNPRRGGGLFV